jgi:hypothetical protein
LENHTPSDVFTARYLPREEAPHHTAGRVESEFIHLVDNLSQCFRIKRELVPPNGEFMHSWEVNIRDNEEYVPLVLKALRSINEFIQNSEKLNRLSEHCRTSSL